MNHSKLIKMTIAHEVSQKNLSLQNTVDPGNLSNSH